jgi:hypothetical protein
MDISRSSVLRMNSFFFVEQHSPTARVSLGVADRAILGPRIYPQGFLRFGVNVSSVKASGRGVELLGRFQGRWEVSG